MKRIFAAVLFFYLLVGFGYYVNADMYIPLSPRIINHNLLVNGEVTAQGFVSQRESGEVGAVTIYEDPADGNSSASIVAPDTGFTSSQTQTLGNITGILPVVVYSGYAGDEIATGDITIDVSHSEVVFPANAMKAGGAVRYTISGFTSTIHEIGLVTFLVNSDMLFGFTIPVVASPSRFQCSVTVYFKDAANQTGAGFIFLNGLAATISSGNAVINNATTEATCKVALTTTDFEGDDYMYINYLTVEVFN